MRLPLCKWLGLLPSSRTEPSAPPSEVERGKHGEKLGHESSISFLHGDNSEAFCFIERKAQPPDAGECDGSPFPYAIELRFDFLLMRRARHEGTIPAPLTFPTFDRGTRPPFFDRACKVRRNFFPHVIEAHGAIAVLSLSSSL